MQIEFFVDDVRYLWRCLEGCRIVFCVHDSNTKLHLKEWEDWASLDWEWDGQACSFDITGVCRKPYAVFRKVQEITLAWVADRRPGHFHFSANEARKARIYRHLLQRALPRLSVAYGWHEHEGRFECYRLRPF